MTSIEPNWAALILFAGVWTVTCLALLTLVGMVPLRSRPHVTEGGAGVALVVGNLALLALLACGAILYAATTIRWSSAVITGGLVILFAPALFQVWPKDWRDSRAGLYLLIAMQACALAALAAAVRSA
jgi:hypothetical protein